MLQRTTQSGRADEVKYSGIAKWILGGVGEFPFTDIRPHREYAANDLEIVEAAPLGSPCTIWFDSGGTMRLRVWFETYAEEAC